MKTKFAAILLALTAAAAPTAAQTGHDALSSFGRASHLIVPQSRSFQLRSGAQPVTIQSVQARISILGQTARTSLELVLHNPSSQQAEAVLLLPVPDQAAISGFLFDGQRSEPTAQLLVREEARRLYDSIVAKLRDPALLEFAGYNLIRSSIFPLAPGGTQRVHVTYEHLLSADGNRVDYVLPRSESLDQRAPWKIFAEVHSKSPISTIYSPSHDIVSKRVSPTHVKVKIAETAQPEPGAFLMSYLLERGDDVTASLFTYPDPAIGGGYFLLLAGLPAHDEKSRKGLLREVTVVLDRSGSMAGIKMDQARAAALQVLEGLADGERFNIVDYSTTVATFAAAPVQKDRAQTEKARAYLAALRPGGGTNIHDALVEALRQKPTPGTLPIVLFLTDGLPTVGQTGEVSIREMVEKGNPHGRRIFTFGVGHDVNVPLLDRVAESTRATTTYVSPGEDVEVKVGQVFRKLYGPVLAAAQLTTLDAEGEIDTRRVREQQPQALPDLFENDQLIVLGQYRGEDPLHFRLTGNYLGRERQFKFEFDLDKATTRNAFVPRLWASRRIAFLIDQVRQAGAQQASMPLVKGTDPFQDPRMRELRDEILRLSTRFGILSEYTAFLATEGTQLSDWHNMVFTCGNELNGKAMQTRWGIAAVNQGSNILQLKNQSKLNHRNSYLDDKLNRVEVSTVQQVHDRAFFLQGKRWVDGRIILGGNFEEPEAIRYGSPEHLELLRELVRQGRAGILSLSGEILIQIDGKNVLVVNDGC